MGKYTTAAEAEAKLANDLARRQFARQYADFKKGEVLGTPSINGTTEEMISICTRFIDNAVLSIEDPAFDRVQFQIIWNDSSGLFADEQFQNSALAYLKETGETERYAMLKKVIELLRSLFDSTRKSVPRSYYLQAIDGIDAFNTEHQHVGTVCQLTLHLLEDVRWTTRTIMTLLNDIFYDKRNQIEILPKNLRRFSCLLSITDTRNLSDIDAAGDVKPADDAVYLPGQEPKPTGMFYDNYGHVQCVLVHCQSAYFGELKPLPGQVSNVEFNPAIADIPLSVLAYDVEAILPAYDAVVTAFKASIQGDDAVLMDKKQFVKSVIKQVAVAAGKEFLEKSANLAASYASSMVTQQMDKLGITDAINTTINYMNPSYLISQYGGKAEELLGIKQTAKIDEQYFTDKRKIDSKDIEVPQYKDKLP